MKPNELMIDDWVEYGQYITTVRSLSDKIVLSGCIGRLDEVRPVPITTEILTANGFEKKETRSSCHYANYINHSPVYAEQTIGDQWEIDIYQNGKINMFVRYVHELQHILRLQGLTDFADQFKVKGGQP